MKAIRNFPLFLITLLMAFLISQPAFAAKTLRVGPATGPATVNNSGNTDESREVVLDLTTTDFGNVNGMVFTLAYDSNVFDYVGLVQADKAIDNNDYSTVTPPTDPNIIGNTIYYQANPANPGRVLIAAAGAKYFTTSNAEYVPFRVKFRVKQYQGKGLYDIKIQKTIIGPETAKNAGYNEHVALDVAAGLAPDAPPETAESFPVTLFNGQIDVKGGYTLAGSVKYGLPLDSNADGAEVKLFKMAGSSYSFVSSTLVANGRYSFSNQPGGTYRVRVDSVKLDYQRSFERSGIAVSDPITAMFDPIVLEAHKSLSGKVTLKGPGMSLPGLKVKVVKKADPVDPVVIGYFNVDAKGNFVTRLLPGNSGDYAIYAVYGGVESTTAMTYGQPFEYDIALTSLTVSIAGMNGKNYMVHVVQGDGLLEKKTTPKLASADPELVTIPYLISGKEYRVSVVGDGIPVTYYDNDVDPKQTAIFSESDLITVPADTVVFDFSSINANTITGKATEGNAGVEISIYAIKTDYSNVYVTKSSPATGDYTLDVTPGKYIVYGQYKGASFYYKTSTESTQKFAEKGLADASNDVVAVNIILDTTETNAYFHGTVKEKRADGNPHAFGLIIATSAKREIVFETNEKGEYTLKGFADDEEATIFLPAFPGSEQKAKASNNGTQKDFVVNQGALVTGKVQVGDDAGTKVVGARVYLKDTDQKLVVLPVKSNNDGRFALAYVPMPGLYTIHAEYHKYKIYSEKIDVSGDRDLTLKMLSGAFIQGVVTEKESSPLKSLDGVTVIVLGGGKSYSTKTAGGGIYKVEGLEDGQIYNVFADMAGYKPYHAPSVKADNSGKEENIEMEPVGITHTVSGTITEGGSNVPDTTKVTLYSVLANVFLETTTSAGGYLFADVIGSDGYVLYIKRDGKPPIRESIGSVDKNTTKDVAIIDGTITGTIDLSDNMAGQTVRVYLVSQSEDVLQTVMATDKEGGDYEYTFTVMSGVNYKIAAFCEGYEVKWSNGKDGFSTADNRVAGDTANISLIKP